MRAQEHDFFVGQSVMARDLRPGLDWVPAVIVECLGPVVATSDQLLWKRHIDLLRELAGNYCSISNVTRQNKNLKWY